MSIPLNRVDSVPHWLMVASLIFLGTSLVRAEPVVPGTGSKPPQVGDDFEDESWEYIYNLPKSSRNIGGQERQPSGEAKNGRWYEGMLRGQPDRRRGASLRGRPLGDDVASTGGCSAAY